MYTLMDIGFFSIRDLGTREEILTKTFPIDFGQNRKLCLEPHEASVYHQQLITLKESMQSKSREIPKLVRIVMRNMVRMVM